MKLSMSITSPRTKPRQPVGLPKVMLAIGGQAPKAIRSVECYDYKDDRWFHLSEMPGTDLVLALDPVMKLDLQVGDAVVGWPWCGGGSTLWVGSTGACG